MFKLLQDNACILLCTGIVISKIPRHFFSKAVLHGYLAFPPLHSFFHCSDSPSKTHSIPTKNKNKTRSFESNPEIKNKPFNPPSHHQVAIATSKNQNKKQTETHLP